MLKIRSSLLIVFILTASFNIGNGQGIITRQFIDSISQSSVALDVDQENNIYFIRGVSNNQSSTFDILKIDSAGEIIDTASILLNQNQNLSPKDIIVTKDQQIIVLYFSTNSGSLADGSYLEILELSLDLEIQDRQRIRLSPFTFTTDQARIGQLSDSTFAIMSPLFFDLFGQFDNAIISRFDRQLNYQYSMSLEGISMIRARCFALVENNMILAGSNGPGGIVLNKINLIDTMIAWSDTLIVPGTDFNRVYNPAILKAEEAYAIVCNYANMQDTLSGIRYYKIGWDGSILQERLFNDVPWYSSHFPGIVESDCQTLNIFYRIEDTLENFITRHITLSLENELLADSTYDFIEGEEFMVSYKSYKDNRVISIGSTRDSSGTINNTLFVNLPLCNDFVSEIKPTRRIKTSSLNFYPNPVSEAMVQFDLKRRNHEILDYKIFDLTGKVKQVGVLPLSHLTHSLYIGNLDSGVYTIWVSGENQNYVGRIVKH